MFTDSGRLGTVFNVLVSVVFFIFVSWKVRPLVLHVSSIFKTFKTQTGYIFLLCFLFVVLLGLRTSPGPCECLYVLRVFPSRPGLGPLARASASASSYTLLSGMAPAEWHC